MRTQTINKYVKAIETVFEKKREQEKEENKRKKKEEEEKNELKRIENA